MAKILKGKQKKAGKKAVKQYVKHKKTAKSGYGKGSVSASRTARGGTKGYATRVGSTTNVGFKAPKRKKK